MRFGKILVYQRLRHQTLSFVLAKAFSHWSVSHCWWIRGSTSYPSYLIFFFSHITLSCVLTKAFSNKSLSHCSFDPLYLCLYKHNYITLNYLLPNTDIYWKFFNTFHSCLSYIFLTSKMRLRSFAPFPLIRSLLKRFVEFHQLINLGYKISWSQHLEVHLVWPVSQSL